MNKVLTAKNIPDYIGVELIRFSRGSIVAHTNILFAVGASLDEAVVSSVADAVETAVLDGEFDSLDVDKSVPMVLTRASIMKKILIENKKEKTVIIVVVVAIVVFLAVIIVAVGYVQRRKKQAASRATEMQKMITTTEIM